MTGTALSGGAVLLCGPSQPLPRTQCLHHDRKHACPDSLWASTSASMGSSGEIAFLGARASVCSVSSTSIRSARGLLSASTNLELALGRGDSPLKAVLSEDSAWIGCRCNVGGLTGGPAPVRASNSVPAGEESVSFTSPAG